MKPGTRVRLTNLMSDADQIEAETGCTNIIEGLTGKLTTGKPNDPEYNPGYYEVQLDDGQTLCFDRREFSLWVDNTIAATKVVKRDDEYVVEAYNPQGKRIPEADYYTDDKQDAYDTAEAMLKRKN